MKRILIIEDDPVVANIYRTKLQNSGYEVAVAHDGDSGLQKLNAEVPHLLILDLGLPKVNGVEVIKRLRASPATANLPVVVLSNSYVTDLVQEAWKAGANRCLTKSSCTPSQLTDIIQSVLITPSIKKPVSETDSPDPAMNVASTTELSEPGRSDAQFQAQLRQSFLSSGPSFVNDLRRRFKSFAQQGAEARPVAQIVEFYRSVHSLTGNAGAAGFLRIATLSAALEALLKELYEKPKNLGPSPIRTIATAIDSLAELFNTAMVTTTEDELPPAVLVVDDDIVSRRTVSLALEKARLRPLCLDDPVIALKCLEQNSFDLIFSDVNMPQMSGFDFCTKMRELPNHKATPLVFITTQADFESRATSKLSGGSDLMGKPFLLVELTVKALTFLQREKK